MSYQTLPEVIKHLFTEKEYLSIPEEEKRTLQTDLTNPEVEEDG